MTDFHLTLAVLQGENRCRLTMQMTGGGSELISRRFCEHLKNVLSGKVLFDDWFLPRPGNRLEKIPRELKVAIAYFFSLVLEQPAGIRTDFFRAGGKSLQAARVLTRIRVHCGVTLTFADLACCPTPEKLAHRIQTGSKSPLMVRLNKATAGTPFFCIHDQGGDIHGIQTLAASGVWDRPFFALRASGLAPGESFDPDIESMARRYAKEISSAYPDGPLLIGGMCTGSIIALETARVLSAGGRKISGLMLLRPTPPKSLRDKSHYFLPIFRYFRSVKLALMLFAKPFYKAAVAGRLLFSGSAGQRKVWRIFSRSLKTHEAGSILCPSGLILSREKFETFPEYIEEWSALTGKKMRVAAAGFGHYGMLKGPAAVEFAQALKSALDALEKEQA